MKVKHILAICAIMLACTTAFAQNHARGQLKVGAAKVDVTPAENQLRQGSYGILDHPVYRIVSGSADTDHYYFRCRLYFI